MFTKRENNKFISPLVKGDSYTMKNRFNFTQNRSMSTTSFNIKKNSTINVIQNNNTNFLNKINSITKKNIMINKNLLNYNKGLTNLLLNKKNNNFIVNKNNEYKYINYLVKYNPLLN